jgi:hypothetical protein
MDSLFGGDEATQKKIQAGEANMAKYNEKVAAAGDAKSGKADSPGFFGPSYSFDNEIKSPKEIGVRADGSPGGILDAVSGVNYYSDVIGFGQKTMFNFTDMQPMGIRYFMPTGSTCSNGAQMWEYVDSIPKGDLLGNRVKTALSDMGLPGMRGLAPGIMEDARDALNPMPIFRAAMGSGYPKCKQVTLPVGDGYGQISSRHDGTLWIKGKIDPGPTQTKWVQDRDASGIPLFIDRIEYENAPKTLYPDGSKIEGFSDKMFWEKYIDRKSMAGLMVCGLAIAFLTFSANKQKNM